MSDPRRSYATRPLQIHVTRKCNLQCLHCYSSSGPDQTEALDSVDLKLAVDDAHELGYSLVSLSGGEPFLYPHMTEVLAHAKVRDMKTAVVTNGMFLDKRRLDALKPVLDLVVISLDGEPARHNRMRANPKAFEVMAAKVPALRATGIAFGFLFTLCRDNAHELEWAADFAAQAGASILQVHPLDLVGRAAEGGAFERLDVDEPAALMAARRAADIQKRMGERLRIVVDFQPRLPEELRGGLTKCEPTTFADQVHPLCIETDGAIVPMGHGFSRDYQMGQLGHGRLRDMARDWIAAGQADRYEALTRQVRADADALTAPQLQNLAQNLRRASHQGAKIAAE